MGWTMWVLIGLLVLSYMQYQYPEKTQFVGTAYDPVKQQIDKVLPTTKGQLVSKCPEDYSPVCFNNITYQNSCKAGEMGITNVIQGECQ